MLKCIYVYMKYVYVCFLIKERYVYVEDDDTQTPKHKRQGPLPFYNGRVDLDKQMHLCYKYIYITLILTFSMVHKKAMFFWLQTFCSFNKMRKKIK